MPSLLTDKALEHGLRAMLVGGVRLHLLAERPIVWGGMAFTDLVEVTGGGYQPVDLLAEDWTFESGNPSVALHAAREFQFTADIGFVHGHCLVLRATGQLLGVETYLLPDRVQVPGSRIVITPRILAKRAA